MSQTPDAAHDPRTSCRPGTSSCERTSTDPTMPAPVDYGMSRNRRRKSGFDNDPARILTPTPALLEPMFRDPDDPKGGGIGLYRLEFYSPKRFQLFGKVFQQVLVGRELGFRYCNDIPNPPDNSG